MTVARDAEAAGVLVDAKSMPRWTALFDEIGKADPDMIGRELGRASEARILGDLERAEDAVQDAFTKALERWPTIGIPDNPGAWIVTTARNSAVDRICRDVVLRDKTAILARLETEATGLPASGEALARWRARAACRPGSGAPGHGCDRRRAANAGSSRGATAPRARSVAGSDSPRGTQKVRIPP